MDPTALLSEINFHSLLTERPLQRAELHVIMNQAVQILQKFIEVLDRILTPSTAGSSMSSTHQRQHTRHAAPATDGSISSNENPTSPLDWTAGRQPERQQQYAQAETVNTVKFRSALIHYIEFLCSYKILVYKLVVSVAMTETQQQLGLPNFVAVQIGALHTVVTPRLQIALLVQLISQEMRHKAWQLATRINEAWSNMDPSHPEAFIVNISNKAIRSKEEDLRKELDLLSEGLKMHVPLQGHQSKDR
ncbi:hypothetical protein GGI42DRAFT_366197 [Trichoderma sp. SZMC 28013]